MKTKNMYLNRLFKFYFYLGLHHSEQPLVVTKGNSGVNHTSGVLNMLPNIFEQWELDEDGNAQLKSHPELSTLTAVGYFFRLSVEELFSLFVPKYNERFLGGFIEVNESAQIKDLLANILGFIHVKQEFWNEQESEKLNKRSTIKNNYYENYNRKHPVSQLWA